MLVSVCRSSLTGPVLGEFIADDFTADTDFFRVLHTTVVRAGRDVTKSPIRGFLRYVSSQTRAGILLRTMDNYLHQLAHQQTAFSLYMNRVFVN